MVKKSVVVTSSATAESVVVSSGTNTLVKKVIVGKPIRRVSSGAFLLSNLGDVNVTGAVNNSILVYDSDSLKWIATTTLPTELTVDWPYHSVLSQSAETNSTDQVTIASFLAADYTSGEILVTANDGTDRQISKLLVSHNDVTATGTEYGIVYTAGKLASYDIELDSSGNFNVLARSTTSNNVKFNSALTLFKI